MKIKLILMFVLFYFGALLITLPAYNVLRFIPDNSAIKISAVSGTLWNGRTERLTYKKQYHLQQLAWQIDWWALIRLQLKLDVEFNNGAQAMSGKGAVMLGFSGVSVADLLVDISAPELVAYTGLSLPATVNGDISLVIKDAQQGNPYCQRLDGFIVWRNARVSSEIGDLDLETANIDLDCVNGDIAADVQQASEQLTTTATFLLQEKRAYQLQGLLKPGEQLDPAIKALFSWAGSQNQAGETVLKFNGTL